MNGSGEVVERPLHGKKEEVCHRLGSDERQEVRTGREVAEPSGAKKWTAPHRLSCNARFRLGTDT